MFSLSKQKTMKLKQWYKSGAAEELISSWLRNQTRHVFATQLGSQGETTERSIKRRRYWAGLTRGGGGRRNSDYNSFTSRNSHNPETTVQPGCVQIPPRARKCPPHMECIWGPTFCQEIFTNKTINHLHKIKVRNLETSRGVLPFRLCDGLAALLPSCLMLTCWNDWATDFNPLMTTEALGPSRHLILVSSISVWRTFISSVKHMKVEWGHFCREKTRRDSTETETRAASTFCQPLWSDVSRWYSLRSALCWIRQRTQRHFQDIESERLFLLEMCLEKTSCSKTILVLRQIYSSNSVKSNSGRVRHFWSSEPCLRSRTEPLYALILLITFLSSNEWRY